MKSNFVVVLIGFDYYNSNEDTLPGTLNDIRGIYEYFNELSPKKITLITDIETEDNSKKGIIDPNDVIFINKTKSCDEYILYDGKRNMLDIITKTITGAEKVLFYYTGHSHNQKIMLPDKKVTYLDEVNYLDDFIDKNDNEENKENNFLSFETLKSIFLKQTTKKSQIVFWMDCCYGNGLGLPFMMNLKNGIYYLNGDIINMPTQEIICVSASLSNQSSFSDIGGSVFTKELLNKMEEYKKNKKSPKYVDLIREIGFKNLNRYSQTFNVFSSRPNLKKMWHWLFCHSTMKINHTFGVFNVCR